MALTPQVDPDPSALKTPDGFRIAAVWVLAAGLLLGSFWYIRNWALTGNPFFPYGVTVETTQVLLPAAERTTRLDLNNFLNNLGSFAQRFGDRQQRITPDLPNTTGWGWVAYGLGLPALVWGLMRRRGPRVLFAGFAVSLLVLFFSSPNSPWNMRYAIWFPALFALAIGFAFDGVLSAERGVLRGLRRRVCGVLSRELRHDAELQRDSRRRASKPCWPCRRWSVNRQA